MNYRHGFHAGNIADVLKHAVLLAVLDHMAAKASAITVLDSHAGAGLYRRAGDGEWREGIARLEAATVRPALAERLVGAVAAVGPDRYPGSPLLALSALRAQDRLVACECQPDEAALLRRAVAGDRRAAIHCRDGWGGLKALLPAATPRALVLIDPPFEDQDDFARLADGLVLAARRAPTAPLIGWYPVKGRRGADRLKAALQAAGLAKVLQAELLVDPADDPRRLAGSGVILVRPPYRLDHQLTDELPAVLALLGRRATGHIRVAWLTDDQGRAAS